MTTIQAGARWASVALAAAMVVGCSPDRGGDALTQARAQIQAGQADAAVVLLKQHLSEQPSSGEARFILGTLLLGKRDAKAAEVELRKALELGHDKAQVLPLLAEALLSDRQFTKLLDELGNTSLPDAKATAAVLGSAADAALQQGDRQRAAALAQRALAASPVSARAVQVQAKLLAMQGDSKAALQRMEALLAAEPRQAESWQVKGDLQLYGLQDLDGALASYAKAIEIQPDLFNAHFARIQVLLFRRDVAGAKQAFDQLKKVAPGLLSTRFVEAQLAYLENDYVKARTLLQGLLGTVQDDVRVLTFSGAVSMATKEWLLAENNLGRAVQLAPDMPLPRKLLAQTLLVLGKPQSALAALEPVLARADVDATSLSLAAQAHVQRGEFRRADDLYQRARSADPSDVSVRTSAALSRLAQGDAERALADLEALARQDLGNPAALALLSARMRRNEFDAALALVEGMIAKDPGKAMLIDLKGRVLQSKGDRAGAALAFNKAVEVDPNYFPAVQNLAMNEVADKKPDQARTRLEAFVKRQPRHGDARMTLAELLIHQKASKEEVAKVLEELIRADPSHIRARLKLIELHLAARAPKLAVTAAQEALAANADRPELLEMLARAQLAAGEAQQAQSTYSRLVSLSPSRVDYVTQLADVQVLLDNTRGAESTLRRAFEADPDNVSVRARLLGLFMASKQPQKAIDLARDLQKARPKSASGFLFEADIEADRKNWASAAEALERGLKAQVEPRAVLAARRYVALQQAGREGEAAAWLRSQAGDAAVLLRLADLQLQRKEFAAAEQHYLAALKLKPNDANAHNNVAWLLLKKGGKGALEHSTRAVELAKDQAPFLDTHAMALADAGRVVDGVAAARRAVELAPTVHLLRLNLAKLLVKAQRWTEARVELERLRQVTEKFDGADEIAGLLASLPAR